MDLTKTNGYHLAMKRELKAMKDKDVWEEVTTYPSTSSPFLLCSLINSSLIRAGL